MELILISGKAQHGKDTLAEMIKYHYESMTSSKVKTLAFADTLKGLAKQIGWNGEKNDKGRTLLQDLGDTIKAYHGLDFFSQETLKRIILDYELEPSKVKTHDLYIITDWRFDYELTPLEMFDPITIRVNRPYFDNGLSPEQKNHASERNLDDYEFDYTIKNDGDLLELDVKVREWVGLMYRDE